jgi:hypothetical protein
MSLRADGWSLTAEGIGKGDSDLIRQGNKRQADAEGIVKSLNK